MSGGLKEGVAASERMDVPGPQSHPSSGICMEPGISSSQHYTPINNSSPISHNTTPPLRSAATMSSFHDHRSFHPSSSGSGDLSSSRGGDDSDNLVGSSACESVAIEILCVPCWTSDFHYTPWSNNHCLHCSILSTLCSYSDAEGSNYQSVTTEQVSSYGPRAEEENRRFPANQTEHGPTASFTTETVQNTPIIFQLRWAPAYTPDLTFQSYEERIKAFGEEHKAFSSKQKRQEHLVVREEPCTYCRSRGETCTVDKGKKQMYSTSRCMACQRIRQSCSITREARKERQRQSNRA